MQLDFAMSYSVQSLSNKKVIILIHDTVNNIAQIQLTSHSYFKIINC